MSEPELSYEAARDQLVEIVRQLESGSVPLSESMKLWERGEELARVCQQWLDGARAKIEAARPTPLPRPTPDGVRATPDGEGPRPGAARPTTGA